MRGLFPWALFVAVTAAAGQLVSLIPSSAAPASIVVTSTANGDDMAPGDGLCVARSGACTLAASLQEASALGSARFIRLPAGVYRLDRELRLSGTATISGSSGTTITGNRIVVEEGANVTLTDVTVRDIDTTYPGAACGAGIQNMGTLHLIRVDVIHNTNRNPGGGICNNGTLTMVDGEITRNGSVFTGDGGGLLNYGDALLTDVMVKENHTNGPGQGRGRGGGIHNGGALTLLRVEVRDNTGDGAGAGLYNAGNATVDSSTFSGNHLYTSVSVCCVAEGAGVYNSGTLVLLNTAIHGNTANGGPGGLANHGAATIEGSTISGNGYGGISNSGSLAFLNTTVSGNYGGPSPDVAGYGAIFNDGSIDIAWSTITANTPSHSTTGGIISAAPGIVTANNTIIAGNGGSQCAGFIVVSEGHNVSDDISCGLTANGDTQDTDALLGPLASNGGLTQTHALLPDSPAINSGDNTACPDTDQRGAGRPVNGVCDIGAYEFGGDLPTPSPPPPPTPTPVPPSRVDIDCNGQVNSADAQLILRFVVGLPVQMPPGCPPFVPTLRGVAAAPTPPPRESPLRPHGKGDADCDGKVTSVDALMVLRQLAQLPVYLPGGCPPL